MTRTCPKCGSTKVEVINAEIAFARGKAEPVYAVTRQIVCLDCGFAEFVVSQQTLDQLKSLVKFRVTKAN